MEENSSQRHKLATFISSLAHRNENYCPFHSHPAMEIVYHPNGRGITKLRDKTAYDFATDTVIIYWPEEEHDQVTEKAGEDICLQLSVSNISWLPKQKKCLKLTLQDNSLKREIINLERTPANRTAQQQHSTDLRITALLLDLITLAMEQENANQTDEKLPLNVVKANGFILDNFNHIASIRDVAVEIGVSYDYLRHQFRDAYRISMKQHLLNTRIEQARQFLTYSPLSLKQIAEECGFDNNRYFSTSFKKHTGMTPGKYRKENWEI